MGTILASNFKLYKCATWDEGTSHGGDISALELNADTALTGTMTFAASATVTGSGTAFTTELAVGDKIYNYTDDSPTKALTIIAIASNTSLTLASSYAGTAGASKTGHKIATNENIFDNITDDQRISGVTEYRKVYFKNLNADSVSIKCWISQAFSASNEHLSIALAVSTSDTQSAASAYTYYTPDSISHANVLDCGALAQNAYKGVWLKRIVDANGNGYAIDTMALGFGMY